MAPASAAETVALEPVALPPPPAVTLDRLDPPPGASARVTVPAQGQGVVVLHFFATWCEPCREELPDLAAFARSSAAQVVLVDVVLVDVAEPEARIRRFFETVPAPGPILLDRDRAASRAFGIAALPSSLVLADGVPRLLATGPVAWTDPAVRARILDLADPHAPSGPQAATRAETGVTQ